MRNTEISTKYICLPEVAALSKVNVSSLAATIVRQANESQEDIVELDVKLKFLEDAIASARACISDKVLLVSRGRKEIHGVKIGQRSGFPLFDYEKDPEYAFLKEALAIRKEQLTLSSETSQTIVIDGETIPKVPVKSFTKDAMVYTLKV